jgi:predicted nucleic-acid-binding protein
MDLGMKSKIIDTNFIIRFLTEKPEKIVPKFKGIFDFFVKLEKKEITVFLPDLVIFEAFFVLTSYYEIEQKIVAGKLTELIMLSGIEMNDKLLIIACFEILKKQKVDLVDAYICALARKRGDSKVYSFDKDIEKLGLEIEEIK